MGQQCKVCAHAEVSAIELAVARGVSGNTLAKQYGMSQASIWRHTHSCVVARAFKKHEALPQRARIDSLGMLMTVANTLERLSVSAEQENKLMVAVQAQGKLIEATMHLHELQPKETQAVDISKTPEFAALRTAILEALRPFPEALQAVTRALAPGTRGDS